MAGRAHWTIIFATAVQIASFSASAEDALPTPQQFATAVHGLTFRTPVGASYCPLPADWIGSDHGTVVFLVKPHDCGGAGYPSSSRWFAPESTPRIEIYYGYWLGEEETPLPTCSLSPFVRLLGERRPLCTAKIGAMVQQEVAAKYLDDSSASEVVVTLITTQERLAHDTAVFQSLLRSMRTCVSTWLSATGKPFKIGTGKTCPSGRFF
jgi:hypothetical protein